MIADIITFSRMIISGLLLVLPPSSPVFGVLYLLCGVSDVLDGFVARKLHTESERGARLDSAADLVFAVIYAVKVLPALSVPYWIWVWTAVIAAVKITGIVIASRSANRLQIAHSFGNKLTGVMLFLLPLSVCVVNVKHSAALVCVAATVTTIKEITKTCKGAKNAV